MKPLNPTAKTFVPSGGLPVTGKSPRFDGSEKPFVPQGGLHARDQSLNPNVRPRHLQPLPARLPPLSPGQYQYQRQKLKEYGQYYQVHGVPHPDMPVKKHTEHKWMNPHQAATSRIWDKMHKPGRPVEFHLESLIFGNKMESRFSRLTMGTKFEVVAPPPET